MSMQTFTETRRKKARNEWTIYIKRHCIDLSDLCIAIESESLQKVVSISERS